MDFDSQSRTIGGDIFEKIAVDGATLYCTHQPCTICARMIINAGIKRVVYKNGYPDEFSLQLFNEAGVLIEKMD